MEQKKKIWNKIRQAWLRLPEQKTELNRKLNKICHE